MRLLLDEMFSPLLARELRRRGHDALAIGERPEWQGLTDPEVFALARTEQRTVVTNNVRDFRPLHAESIATGTGGVGLVLVPASVPRTRAATGALADRLEAALRTHPDGLLGTETWI